MYSFFGYPLTLKADEPNERSTATWMRKATGNYRIISPKIIMEMSEEKSKSISVSMTEAPAVISMKSDREVQLNGSCSVTSNDEFEPKPSGSSLSDVVHMQTRRKELRFGTWNVRSLFAKGKLQNLIEEAEALKMDLFGICETRWDGVGDTRIDGWRFMWSGGDVHAHGVGILMRDSVSRSVKGFWPVSKRVMMVKLSAKPIDICVLQVYAPTTDHSDEEVEEFYGDVARALKQVKSGEVVFVMGDLNAKVGSSSIDGIVGQFGLGYKNDRGARLVEFCEEHDMVITNTHFKQPARRLYTWKSPGDLHRNQIDYIIVNGRYKNAVKNVRTYPGADIYSDHNPVVADVCICLKKIKSSKPQSLRCDVAALRDKQMRDRFTVAVDNKFSMLAEPVEVVDKATSTEDQWSSFKATILEAAEDVLPKKRREAKKEWMTTEILDLMKDRKSYKDKDDVKYHELERVIKTKCNEAKEAWMEEQCEMIESMEECHNYSGVSKKVNELTGRKRRNHHGCIKNKSGDVLFEQEDIISRWNEYIEELYGDVNRAQSAPGLPSSLDGPPILIEEVRKALGKMKCGKAPGPDGLCVDFLKVLGDGAVLKLTDLCNAIYSSGRLPEEMKRSAFIALPKKVNASECKEYRTISLMSHTLKVLLKVLEERIKGRIDAELPPAQYGFRAGVGTRDAIVCLRNLCERCVEMQQNVFTCFIDYEKAFDRVQHEELMRVLGTIGIDGKDLRLLQNLYWEQEAGLRVDGQVHRWAKIEKGVRQGCVLSPALFNIYSEMVLRKIEGLPGISVGGRCINNIRYADDTVLIASTEADLQKLLDVVVDMGERVGLRLNVRKTKSMVFSKVSPAPRVNVSVRNEGIEQVDRFVYLGSIMTEDGRCEEEVKRRIGIAKSAFNSIKSLVCNRSLSFRIRLRMVKCYVLSTFMYAAETWTMNKKTRTTVNAFEMWTLRRMRRISYTDFKSNEKVLEEAGMRRRLLRDVAIRKLRYYGHVIRQESLTYDVLTGRISGKRARGRQRRKWTDDCKIWTGLRVIRDLISCARDRKRWNSMSANPRIEEGT